MFSANLVLRPLPRITPGSPSRRIDHVYGLPRASTSACISFPAFGGMNGGCTAMWRTVTPPRPAKCVP